MTKLPIVSGKAVVKALEKAGFFVTGQTGSHMQLRHTDGRRTTVPVHANRDMPRGTLKGVLRDVQIESEEFLTLLIDLLPNKFIAEKGQIRVVCRLRKSKE